MIDLPCFMDLQHVPPIFSPWPYGLVGRVQGALGAVQLCRDALQLRRTEVQRVAAGAAQGPAGQLGGGASILTLTSGE